MTKLQQVNKIVIKMLNKHNISENTRKKSGNPNFWLRICFCLQRVLGGISTLLLLLLLLL
jgi:hypothetical protein